MLGVGKRTRKHEIVENYLEHPALVLEEVETPVHRLNTDRLFGYATELSNNHIVSVAIKWVLVGQFHMQTPTAHLLLLFWLHSVHR